MRSGVFSGHFRGLFSRGIAEVGATNLFLLFLLAVIIISPLFFVGFTTNDDARFAINIGNGHGHVWDTAWSFSAEQGRIGFLWGYPLYHMPYAVAHRAWYLTVKFGAFFLLLSALYFAVLQSFKSRWIALASLVFFLAFIQNGWDHNALTSYPLYVNFSVTLFLLSLGLFSVAIDRKNLALAGFSGVLYFFVLGNELFVPFFFFYVAMLLSRAGPGESVIRWLMAWKKYVLAIALPLITYLVIYLVWRHIYPSQYNGNQLDGFNLWAAGKVIAIYSLSAFPLASLRFLVSPNAQLEFVNAPGLHNILSSLNVAHFIKPAVAGFLFSRLMTSAHFIIPRARTLMIGAAMTFVGIFLPNLLLGFNQKYQAWVASGSRSYTYTYYSFISAAVFFALVLAYMNIKSRSWHPRIRRVLILTGIMIAMVLSFAVEVRNQLIAFDQKLSHRKWQLMDEVIQSPAFMEIPEGSTVVAPTLSAHQRGIAQAPADYWSQYAEYKTGKKIHFVDDECRRGAPCYALVFRQEAHSDHQFIVLGKIKDFGLLLSSELTVYSMPHQTNAVLLGSFMPGKDSPKLVVNGESVTNVGDGFFSLYLPHVSGEGLVQAVRVTGNVGIFQNRITISHYGVEPRLRPLSAELAERMIDFKIQGYPDFVAKVSGMSGYEPWGRWTDAAVGPVAKFRFRQTLPRKFTLEITARAFGPNYDVPVKVRVGGSEQTFVITHPEKEADTYRLAFETDGTADTLEITPPHPTSPHEINPNSGDARKLGIAFISLKIKS